VGLRPNIVKSFRKGERRGVAGSFGDVRNLLIGGVKPTNDAVHATLDQPILRGAMPKHEKQSA
jgi:hypothetical protein